MVFREMAGLVLTVIAFALTPVAWVSSRAMWAGVFTLTVLGLWLLFTDRVVRKLSRSSNGAANADSSGHAMPSDIHNHTGWRSGGRMETFDSHGAGGGDASD